MSSKLTLTTVQGQAWDQLAKSRLGTEFALGKLLAANWHSRGVLLFSGDVAVSIPAAEADAAKSPTESLPPWKR